MADLKPLTPAQEVMLIQYHLARIDWEANSLTDDRARAYFNALDACQAAGFDPFHYPAPQ